MKLVLDADGIPRSDALRAFWGEEDAAIIRAATAGDDYQIVFTAAPNRHADVMRAANDYGTQVTRIGRVEAGTGVELTRQGRTLAVPRPGYRHF